MAIRRHDRYGFIILKIAFAGVSELAILQWSVTEVGALYKVSDGKSGPERAREARVRAGDIETLLSLWTKDRRARGGWWALAGFSYQSALYLFRFFQDLEDQIKPPSELAKTELLSDIMANKCGVFTIIQVKRTLDRPKLIAALREFYEIAKLCKLEFLPELRFQIACIECTTPLHPRDFTIQEIGGDTGDAEIWTQLLECFDKDRPIIEEPDPLDHLYDLLWHVGIRNTAGFVDNCLGLLLRVFSNPSQYAIIELARSLSDMFYRCRESNVENFKRIGQILRTKDFESICFEGEGDDILFGRPPQLSDLKYNRVRNRPNIFFNLIETFRPWWKEISAMSEMFKIPVFWIEGRSGEGKSVLLLQIAQYIVESEYPPVVCYLSSSEYLPKWVENQRSIQNSSLSSSQLPAVCIIDDLHFVQNPQYFEISLQSSTNLNSPRVAIIACGPTPERKNFQNSYYRYFSISSFCVPNLEIKEMEDFRVWFTERTKKQVELNITDVANRMLVIWIFELLRGESIGEFARNFKCRLISLDLFEHAKAILAVNALELAAPASFIENIPDRQLDEFRNICSSSQLHFAKIEGNISSNGGYQLSHPQINWQLYKEWASSSPTLAQQWGRDLARPFVDAARQSNSIFASKVVFQLGVSPKLSKINSVGFHYDVGTISQALTELYRKQSIKLSLQEVVRILPRWLEVAFRGLVKNLDPDPVQQAINIIGQEAVFGELPAAVAGWLWRLSEVEIYKQEGQKLRFAAEFILFENPKKRGIAWALGVIASKSANSDAAIHLCKQWLKYNAIENQAYIAISALIGRWPNDEEVFIAARCWLSANLENEYAHLLLAPLAAARPVDDEVAEIVIKWVKDNTTHHHAPQVLAPLMAARPINGTVINFALKWWGANSTHHQAYQMLAPLIVARPTDNEVAGIVLSWLRDNPAHPQAYQVLAPLIVARPTDNEVAGIVLSWLRDNPAHPQAYQVLAPLIAARPADDRMVDVALEWMGRFSNHQQAYQVFAPLISARSANDEVVKFALQWVRDNPEHQQVYWLLAPLIAARSTDEYVVRVVLKWTESNPKHEKIYHLLAPLVAAQPMNEDVICAARGWLDDNFDHPQMHHLLITLITRSDGAEEWMRRGEKAFDRAAPGAKRNLLVALLAGSKASHYYIDLTISIASSESNAGTQKFLKNALSRSLARNIRNALIFVAGNSSVEYKNIAARSLASGLRKDINACEEFVKIIEISPADYTGIFLSSCVASKMHGDTLNDTLCRWLNGYRHKKGYGVLLRTLKYNPARWEALKNIGCLNLEVQLDYENLLVNVK